MIIRCFQKTLLPIYLMTVKNGKMIQKSFLFYIAFLKIQVLIGFNETMSNILLYIIYNTGPFNSIEGAWPFQKLKIKEKRFHNNQYILFYIHILKPYVKSGRETNTTISTSTLFVTMRDLFHQISCFIKSSSFEPGLDSNKVSFFYCIFYVEKLHSKT